jgi:ABC-type sulfate transport system permease subunit
MPDQGDNSFKQATDTSTWPKILATIGSPLKLFALIVLACNTVFGVAAAFMSETSRSRMQFTCSSRSSPVSS